MKVRDVLKRLRDVGWVLVRTTGSHRHFKHPTKQGIVTVPGLPSDDLAPSPGRASSSKRDGEWIMENREYVVVYEWAGGIYSAYVPDLPGCVSTGHTLEETECNIREAIKGHLTVMREYGEPIPEPTTRIGKVSVPA